MPQTIPGCDLARSWIDLHRLPENTARRIANDDQSNADAIADLPTDTLVVFEGEADQGSIQWIDPPPNAGCDGPLIAALSARGIAFARVNPRQAREFARAIGVLARTDRVDARVLAQMGARLALKPTAPRSPARARLSDFLRRRKQLARMRKAEKTRRHDAGAPDIRAEIDGMIAILDSRIARLDADIAGLIDAAPALSRQAELLRAVPGVGPTVLAVLPELGRLDQRRIASLAGLARTPAKAGPGAGCDGYGESGGAGARLSTSQRSRPSGASLRWSPFDNGCETQAMPRKPLSSPSQCSSSSSSMP